LRQQVVLGVNNKSLLPVLLPIAPAKSLLSRFTEAAGEMLMPLGVAREKVLSEMGVMNDYSLAPTNERVLGTINEFGACLRCTWAVGLYAKWRCAAPDVAR
jgi:hypothetical protein